MKTEIRRLPFYKEAADIFTMYRNREMAVFLDSALENQLGRYSVIGLYPYLVLKEENGICYRNGEKQTKSFEDILDEELQRRKEKNPTELPLTGGAIGYFSYDYGRKFEQIRTRHPEKIRMPEAMFVFYDVLIIEDKKEKTLHLTARGETEDAKNLLDQVEQEIFNCKPQKKPDRQHHLADFTPNFEKEEYKQTVQRLSLIHI